MQSIPAHMMGYLVRLGAVAIAIIAMLGGCSSLPQLCQPPAQMMMNAEIIFGRNVENKAVVSDAAFAQFVADDITPRFPDGLTVVDAKGQWRDNSGALLREPSKVVLIAFRDDAQRRAALVDIAEAYKRKFHQQSVLTAVRAACVSF